VSAISQEINTLTQRLTENYLTPPRLALIDSLQEVLLLSEQRPPAFSEERLKALWMGFKVRKILIGERVEPLVSRVAKLHADLKHVQGSYDRASKTIATQLLMQLRTKKEAFHQAFGDVMRMKSWYFGSRVALRKQPQKIRKPTIDCLESPIKSPRPE